MGQSHIQITSSHHLREALQFRSVVPISCRTSAYPAVSHRMCQPFRHRRHRRRFAPRRTPTPPGGAPRPPPKPAPPPSPFCPLGKTPPPPPFFFPWPPPPLNP